MIVLKAKDVANILKATFPNCRKREVIVNPTTTVTFYDLNWSGGTRSQYRACTLDGQAAGNMDKYNQIAPWFNPAEGATVEIPVGCCVVESGYFCGKESRPRIYVRPEDMPKYLTH